VLFVVEDEHLPLVVADRHHLVPARGDFDVAVRKDEPTALADDDEGLQVRAGFAAQAAQGRGLD
jgi:hypothetical protein